MAYEALAIAGFGLSVASAYSQIQAADATASSYEFKAQQAELAKQQASIQTQMNNTILQARYNESIANQRVEFMVQGRSGGTIENIMQRDREQFEWDQDFLKQSGIITQGGLDADIAGLKGAAAGTKYNARVNAGLGLLQSGLGLAQVV